MSALELKARAFAKAYPKRPPSRTTGTWAECCGILQVMFGGYLGGATTAQIASNAVPFWRIPPKGDISSAAKVRAGSAPLNLVVSQAPVGAWHYWDIGKYGHVGLDLNGAGSMVFMASTFCTWSWGDDIGACSVTNYGTQSGATYRGWSMNYSRGYTDLPAERAGASKGDTEMMLLYGNDGDTGAPAVYVVCAPGGYWYRYSAGYKGLLEGQFGPAIALNDPTMRAHRDAIMRPVLTSAALELPDVLPVFVTNWPDEGPTPQPPDGDGGTFRVTPLEGFLATIEAVDGAR